MRKRKILRKRKARRPLYVLTLSRILVRVLRKRAPQLAANIIRNNAFLARLKGQQT